MIYFRIQKLPNNLPDLIEMALHDLIETEKCDKYTIDMDEWHATISESKCHVCLGGCILAQRSSIPSYQNICSINSLHSNEDIVDQLIALDEIRLGNISTALAILDVDVTLQEADQLEVELSPSYVPYEDDSEKFKDWLRLVIRTLREKL